MGYWSGFMVKVHEVVLVMQELAFQQQRKYEGVFKLRETPKHSQSGTY